MSDPAVVGAFLEGEVEALEPFDFIAVRPSSDALHLVEVTRSEAGGLEVRVPGRPPGLIPALPVAVRGALRERGFASEDPADPTRPWVHGVADAAAAVALARRVLTEVFDEKPEALLDVTHGSHRQEHEARQKLAALRKRIEPVLTELAQAPLAEDADGDYVLPVHDVHVTVAPRAVPGGPVVVRVFAITNVGVNVAPDLGLFLARLNFGLMFGRFSLDIEHRSIWFDETLLGDPLEGDVLRFAVKVVAATADEWDDRLKQMFGGATYQEYLQHRRSDSDTPPPKPGQGGYL